MIIFTLRRIFLFFCRVFTAEDRHLLLFNRKLELVGSGAPDRCPLQSDFCPIERSTSPKRQNVTVALFEQVCVPALHTRYVKLPGPWPGIRSV